MDGLLRILLIDDEPDDRLLVIRELQREFPDLEVEQVSDGQGLAEALATGRFDLVITDYQLRWTDGLQILATVKQQCPQCPVIMFTNTGNEEVAVEAMKAGLDDYVLNSPKYFARLRAATRSAVEHREARRRSEAQTRKLYRAMEQTADSVVITDRDGIIEYVNSAFERNTGYSREEALGNKPSIVKSGWHTPDFYKDVWLTIVNGGHFQAVFTNRRKNGTLYYEEKTITPLRDEGGRITHFVSTGKDITERKRAEEALRRAHDELEQRIQERTADLVLAKEAAVRASQAKSEFLSRMSHELRTPLNAVLGFAQVLLAEKERPLTAEQRDMVAEILRAGEHLLELVSEILDLGRIESGRLNMELGPVPVSDVMRDCLAVIQPLAQTREITVHNQLKDCAGHHVLADGTRLKQVLLNLLSNAVKYNAHGGIITLSCGERPEGRLGISVADTGPGIVEAEWEDIFQPFNRLGADYSGIEGTGIGLAISKRLMELMGGDIGLESTPGEGSCFFISLPLAGAP